MNKEKFIQEGFTVVAKPLDPGFALRLDSFDIEVYDNGMPKSYRSQ